MKPASDSFEQRSWNELLDEERDDLYNRMKQGADIAALTEEAAVKSSPESFARRLREWGQFRVNARLVVANGDFESHWKLLCKLIGRDAKRPLPKPIKPKTDPSRRKVVVICDTHGFPLNELVVRAIDERPNLVVLDGDVFDCFAFSHWEKDHASPISDELARIRAMLEAFSTNGIVVQLDSGNHDDRAKKYFARRIEPQFMPLVQYNMLELAAMNLPLVSVVKNTYNFTTATGKTYQGAFTNNWITHLGDALIGHAETARKGEIRSVDGFAEWINNWRVPLGWGEIRLIVQAHVHRAGISYPMGGRQVRVEGGFAGDLSTGALQYTHDYGATMYPPPVVGYTVFEQKLAGDWVTDLPSVHFVMV